jgi:hypothetical protein
MMFLVSGFEFLVNSFRAPCAKPGTRNQERETLFLRPAIRRLVRPIQPAIAALQRAVDLVVARVSSGCVRFALSENIVDVGMSPAQRAAAGLAVSAGVVFAKPALHRVSPCHGGEGRGPE